MAGGEVPGHEGSGEGEEGGEEAEAELAVTADEHGKA